MKTIDERIGNLSDELLDTFIKSVSTIYCGNLLCSDCPIRTDDGCIFVKIYCEKERRMVDQRKKCSRPCH